MSGRKICSEKDVIYGVFRFALNDHAIDARDVITQETGTHSSHLQLSTQHGTSLYVPDCAVASDGIPV